MLGAEPEGFWGYFCTDVFLLCKEVRWAQVSVHHPSRPSANMEAAFSSIKWGTFVAKSSGKGRALSLLPREPLKQCLPKPGVPTIILVCLCCCHHPHLLPRSWTTARTSLLLLLLPFLDTFLDGAQFPCIACDPRLHTIPLKYPNKPP